MTRTAFYKSVSEKGREVFEIVKEANLRAIAAVKPGVRFCDIDAAARDYITEKAMENTLHTEQDIQSV